MRTSKKNMGRKSKPKETASDRKMSGQNLKQNGGGLGKTVRLLEQDVERLNRINYLYRQQIEQLESDNLAIYSQIQQICKEKEGIIKAQLMETQRLHLQNQELARIISLLESQIRTRDEEKHEMVIINKQLQQRAKIGSDITELNKDLMREIQRYKIKLLQSERYWLTKIQTHLTNKENEQERSFLQRETDYALKIKLAHQEIKFKDRIIEEKTQEIHKLIQYIQSNLN